MINDKASDVDTVLLSVENKIRIAFLLAYPCGLLGAHIRWKHFDVNKRSGSIDTAGSGAESSIRRRCSNEGKETCLPVPIRRSFPFSRYVPLEALFFASIATISKGISTTRNIVSLP